ncbi:hypothetical protein FRC08_013592 [Ceratobasidium sp. 394]|nr:hypothetical protein FRC08_013592 [Ceratobasidium sp. 394]KAG9095623.1 hypothetical protein FS749_010089 [Ceratobasidium sp. UAMH 11750]
MAATYPILPFHITKGGKALPTGVKKNSPRESVQIPSRAVTSEHSNLENDVVQLKSWLERPQAPFYELTSISLSDLYSLEHRLLSEGIKLRIYEWSSTTRIAVFRMPTSLHNTPGEWLSAQIPYMQAVLDEAAVCGRPLLKSSGDGNVQLKDVGMRGPDQQLKVTTRFDLGNRVEEVLPPQPRVILETAYSQSEDRALEKAASYLHKSGTHTHAVIICKMSYPVTLTDSFKAEIAVWTRELSGHIPTDFPLEDSKEIKHDPRKLSSTQMTGGASPSTVEEEEEDRDELRTTSTATPADLTGSTATTGVENTPRVFNGKHGRIFRRSGTMVVLDESSSVSGRASPSTEDFLKLNVYDLLRCCPLHPNHFPPAYDLLLPLAPLRESMVQELKSMRKQLLGPTEPVQGQGNTTSSAPTSSVTRLRPGPPDAADSDRVQKKARRV